MKILNQQQLGPEGTINFILTPMKNGTSRLFLIDIGTEEARNRISLLVTKENATADTRSLALEVYNDDGVLLPRQVAPFPRFQLSAAYDVELVWSTQAKGVAVFIDDQRLLEISDPRVRFTNLGQEIHFGEDIQGQNQTEMLAE